MENKGKIGMTGFVREFVDDPGPPYHHRLSNLPGKGSVPRALEQWTQMRELGVENNALTGSLPASVLASRLSGGATEPLRPR